MAILQWCRDTCERTDLVRNQHVTHRSIVASRGRCLPQCGFTSLSPEVHIQVIQTINPVTLHQLPLLRKAPRLQSAQTQLEE